MSRTPAAEPQPPDDADLTPAGVASADGASADGASTDGASTDGASTDGASTDGASITPYRDGPLIVRGNFRLVDQDGVEIDPGRGTIALCRCGKSGIKPFCDGTHKRSGFSAPSAPNRPRPAARLLREARRTDG